MDVHPAIQTFWPVPRVLDHMDQLALFLGGWSYHLVFLPGSSQQFRFKPSREPSGMTTFFYQCRYYHCTRYGWQEASNYDIWDSNLFGSITGCVASTSILQLKQHFSMKASSRKCKLSTSSVFVEKYWHVIELFMIPNNLKQFTLPEVWFCCLFKDPFRSDMYIYIYIYVYKYICIYVHMYICTMRVHGAGAAL